MRTLAAIDSNLLPDAQVSALVQSTDQQLNAGLLSAFFTQTFPDYDPTNLATGIYHPVAMAAQEMVSNESGAVPAPNGLGDLAADAIRSIPNGIIANTPANLPGYDFTPIQAGLVASGVLRGGFPAGTPINFADVYDLLSLGMSPDSGQDIPWGLPLVSGYLELADVKKLCALQVLAQTGLIPSGFYLNHSGFRYSLKADQLYTYFKFATAALVLQVTGQKAAAGSAAAQQVMRDLTGLAAGSLASSQALLAAVSSGNVYAIALTKLNDANPNIGQIAANLVVLAQVAVAAADNGAKLSALMVTKAVDAIDIVSGFSPQDAANTGPAADLPLNARVRAVVDLSSLLLLDAVRTQYGVAITVYKSATGAVVLSGADLPGILANRVNTDPTGASIRELKEWMALLSYVTTQLGGAITADYASTSDFTQFSGFGAAVRTRNASYPVASIRQIRGTVSSLQAAQ